LQLKATWLLLTGIVFSYAMVLVLYNNLLKVNKLLAHNHHLHH
jgi:hypothetical protein